MAPKKFGLFKSRSRDQEQPSTENLLHTSTSSDQVVSPSSPIPSTSKGVLQDDQATDLAMLSLDSDDEDLLSEMPLSLRRSSAYSGIEDPQINYQAFKNQASADATSLSTLADTDQTDRQTIADQSLDLDDASTSYDVVSLQFDAASVAASEDMSVYCGTSKKSKKARYKEQKILRDMSMWRASDIEVTENLLRKQATLNDKIKWEAIATSRGLCTISVNCTCKDCTKAKCSAEMADGDAGMGAAPLFNAISIGCQIQ